VRFLAGSKPASSDLLGDARGFARELSQYHRVTAEEVRAAAQRYLGPERRVVLEVMPKSGGKP
jgi:hypothetical protein